MPQPVPDPRAWSKRVRVSVVVVWAPLAFVLLSVASLIAGMVGVILSYSIPTTDTSINDVEPLMGRGVW